MVRFAMRLFPLLLLGLVIASCAAGGPLRNGDFKRVADGREISFGALLAELQSKKVIFIGEVHDNQWHHEIQLAVVRELARSGVPVAIGLEMFSSESQPALDAWVSGTIDLFDFMNVYRSNWTIPWVQYDKILLFAKNHRIPLVGLNIPRDLAQRIGRFGLSSLSTDDRRRLPPLLSSRPDNSYADFLRNMYVDHTAGASFERFLEAQSVRNRAMAWHAVNFLHSNPERTLVVLAGVGHAIKRGVPMDLREMGRISSAVIIPPLSPYAMSTLKSGDADYLMTDD